MTKKIYFPIVLLLVILFSCTKEINLEHLRPKPKLVLNSVVLIEDTITASVSRTWFFTDDHPNVTLNDAEVKVYVNDQLKGHMDWKEGDSEYNSQGFYTFLYKPVVGDRIKITASKEGFDNISAETIIPGKNPILRLSDEVGKEDRYGSFYYYRKIYITFKDMPARKDFYLVNMERSRPLRDSVTWEYTDEYSEWRPAYVDYLEEPLFTSHLSALDKVLGYDWLSGRYGRVFSDDMIHGKEYTMTLSLPSFNYGGSETDPEDITIRYRVNLYSLSESYYRYMKSLIEMEDGTLNEELAKAGLAEPVRIYSNISGGTGIMGACNLDSMTIEVKSFYD